MLSKIILTLVAVFVVAVPWVLKLDFLSYDAIRLILDIFIYTLLLIVTIFAGYLVYKLWRSEVEI